MKETKRIEKSMGTLGGGNHFIEIDKAQDGTNYLVIHSGSRNLGKQVAELYQRLAINLNVGFGDYLDKKEEIIRTYKEQGRKDEIKQAIAELHFHRQKENDIPDDLCFLSGKYMEDYIHDIKICQAFARRNREKMAEIILERTGLIGGDSFHTVHNYIDTEEINMKDGSILAMGKGNPEWNYSAPHGAGRVMSRKDAKNNLALEDFHEAMQGIYTTSVSRSTLDEAPMAYKSLEDIIDVIRDSVDIIEIMKPVYNFKAGGEA